MRISLLAALTIILLDKVGSTENELFGKVVSAFLFPIARVEKQILTYLGSI